MCFMLNTNTREFNFRRLLRRLKNPFRIIEALVCFNTFSPCVRAEIRAQHTFIRLPANYVSMTAVKASTQSATQLVVFVTDKDKEKESGSLFAETYIKQKDTLATLKKTVVPDDTAAFDVCRAQPPSERETVVLLRPNGIYRLGETTPLISIPTIYAHKQARTLPRIRICFDIFKQEGLTFIVPQLGGLRIFRQEKNGTFSPAGEMPFHAELRHMSPLLRGDELLRTQRIMFRLDLPDVQVLDLNTDGLVDLCLASKDRLRCRLQDPAHGLAGPSPKEIAFEARILKDEEELDTNLRVESKLVDLTGDRRPDFVVSRINWNLAELGTTLFVYPQQPTGDFATKPVTTIARRGFFSYQEYFDFDGDGLLDIVAPYAAIDWKALATIYLTRDVDIDFIWYRNRGDGFDSQPSTIHSLSYPVEFKNLPAILGALPHWGPAVQSPAPNSERAPLVFFPKKKAIEWRALKPLAKAGEGKAEILLGRHEAPLGSDSLRLDMDQDGKDEIIFAYPRDPQRQNQLLWVIEKDAP